MEIQYLLLVNAGLKTLKANTFDTVPNLLQLNISNNLLVTLDDRLFSNLTKLEVLDLSNNKLECLHDERLFISQGNLLTLILSNNRLRTLDSSTLSPLTSIRSLVLTGNPFTCDCQLLPTMTWCGQKGLNTSAICEFPRVHKGSLWSVLNMSEICKANETSEVNMCDYTPTTETNAEESTTERSAEESTTERSAEESTRAGVSVAMLAVYVCVTIMLLCVVVVTSAYYWRKLKRQGNLTDNFYYENTEQSYENIARLPLSPAPPTRPSMNETSSKEQLQKSNESECDTALTSVLKRAEKYSYSTKCSLNSEVSAENTTEQVVTEIYHRNSLYIQTQA
jgi:hypothetical protein